MEVTFMPFGHRVGAALLVMAVVAAAPALGVSRDAQEAEIQFSRGLYALNAGHVQEAAQRFEAAHARDPEEARYLLYLGHAENRLGRYRRAQEHLGQAEGMDGELSALPYERGVAAMGLEEWETARTHLEKARRRQPRRGEIYLRLGVVHDRLGQHSEALTYYEKAVGLDPGLRDQAAFYRGRTYLQAGMVDRARDEFKAASGADDERIVELSDDYLGRIEVAEAGPPDKWDLTGYMAATYDDNVVLNPEDPGAEFPISDQEDVRLVTYASVKYRPWMGRRSMFGLGLGVYQSLHEDLDEFDLTGILPELEFRWRDDIFRLHATLAYDDYRLDGDDYLEATSLEVRPGWREGNSGRTDLVLRYEDLDYAFDPRDADEWALGIRQYLYPWTNKKRYVSFEAEYVAHDAGNDFERKERAAGAGFYTPLGPEWDFLARFSYTFFDYENVHSFFETVREDDEWLLVMRATYDLNRWLALVTEYRATEHKSNIPFFDYDRQSFTIGVLARP